MAAMTPFISLSAICLNQPLINFAASAFKPASSAGHEAATAVAAAEVGAAGAVVCAVSGEHKRTDTMNEAEQNNLQMRLVFMRPLYQIQVGGVSARLKIQQQWQFKFESPTRHRRQELQGANLVA